MEKSTYNVDQISKSLLSDKYIENFISIYRNSLNYNLEYEVRFGTLSYKNKITKIQYDNVVKHLKSVGFVFSAQSYTLKMNAEFINRMGRSTFSNIRSEINGVYAIRDFCLTNSLVDEDKNVKENITFLQKLRYKYKLIDNGVSDKDQTYFLKPGNYPDFNFRVSLQEERSLSKSNYLVKQLVNEWNDKKKLYRVVTRIRGTHPDFPYVHVDMSVVRTSNSNKRGNLIPTFNIKDTNIFTNQEQYEIEIEYTKQHILNNEVIVTKQIRNTITNIMRGLQQTNFPVKLSEMNTIRSNYMSLLYNGKIPDRRVYPTDFIGPSSVSLEMKNIVPLNIDSNIPNIRNPYTVTDKADGIRKLLFINTDGKIYLINTNMEVQFTGAYTKSLAHINSLLDGEHILHNKHDNFINLYATFDIYYTNGKDVRDLGFVPKKKDVGSTKYRLLILKEFLTSLNPQYIGGADTLNIKVKKFYYNASKKKGVFKACKKILDIATKYEYETDGIIFTPAHTGVGSDKIGGSLRVKKKNLDSVI